MTKEELDEKYSYQIDEHCMVHLFRGEEDCQQYLTNPLLSAIFKIEALKKENAELDCQMNRNKFCYSCANTTDRCFRNEIGCPCKNYKSYKDENAALNKQLTKAKEIILILLNNFAYPIGREDWTVEDEEIVDKAEQFIREVEE